MLTDFPLHQLPSIEFLASDQSPAFGAHAPSHRINFYAMVWFLEDGGFHYIDFEELSVSKNTIFLIGRNQVHSIPATQLPRAKTIVFSSTFFDRIEEAYLRQLFFPFHHKGISIPDTMLHSMNALFDLIVLESNSVAESGLLVHYTTAMLTQLLRFSKSSQTAPPVEDMRMLKLFQLMETHFKEQRSAGYYAAQIGLTAKRINEILRQKMDTTINGLLNRLLVLEAKRELLHHQHTVKEVAYNLGFSAPSYFARFFKKHTGFTPEVFKAKSPSGASNQSL